MVLCFFCCESGCKSAKNACFSRKCLAYLGGFVHLCWGLEGLEWGGALRAPPHLTLRFFGFHCLFVFVRGVVRFLIEGLGSSEVARRATSADPKPSLFLFSLSEGWGSGEVASKAISPDPKPSFYAFLFLCFVLSFWVLFLLLFVLFSLFCVVLIGWVVFVVLVLPVNKNIASLQF